tara:strand:+ start:208 stop:456 length:249 start_codon:yes stop_codon:yes gene_type:complete
LVKKYGIKKVQLIYVFQIYSIKRYFMDSLNKVVGSISQPAKGKSASSKKRKWREIEEIRDKFQLEKELKIYEDSLEYMLEDF